MSFILPPETAPAPLLKDSEEGLQSSNSQLSNSQNPLAETAQAQERQPASQTRKIFIRSNPSNARIYLNGQFTSKYTPSVLSLSLSHQAQITIKKMGYLSKNLDIDFNKNQSDIEVNLIKKQQKKKTQIQIIQ